MESKTVFKAKLLGVNVQTDEIQLQKRCERYMHEFLASNPRLQKLSGSDLKHSISVSDDGLYFQILLCQHTAQTELPLGSTRRGFIAVNSFSADLAFANKSIHELHQIVIEALNPEVTAAELRSDFSDRHIAVRRIARGRGPSVLNGLLDPNLMHLDPTMAKGTHATLKLCIDRLERRCARVEILGGIDPAVDLTKSVNLKRKVPLYLKPLDQDPATYAVILQCIDQALSIELPVGIVWRSTDGQIAFLECLSPRE